MKNFLAGCATIIILLGIIAFAGCGVALMCGGGDNGDQSGRPTKTPKPTNTLEPTSTPLPRVDAMQVFLDYQANETRANRQYKDRWLTVELGWIDRIDDGGKVVMNADQYGWNQIQLDFKDDDEVIPLERGGHVTAVCKVQGLTWDSLLVFKDCRLAPSVPTEVPTPTEVPVVNLETYSCDYLAEVAQFSSKNYQPDSYIVAVTDLRSVRQEPSVKECVAQAELSNGEFKVLRMRAIRDEDGTVRSGYELSEIE